MLVTTSKTGYVKPTRSRQPAKVFPVRTVADSPHRPSATKTGARTPDWVRVPLCIFRKIHLYAKSKKPTHDHQTVTPFGTHFFDLGSTYAIGRCDSNGAHETFHRRLVKALHAFEVRYRVGGHRGAAHSANTGDLPCTPHHTNACTRPRQATYPIPPTTTNAHTEPRKQKQHRGKGT